MNYKLLVTLLLVYPLVSETNLLAAQVTAEILPTVPVILLAEKTDSAPPSRGAPSSGRKGAGVPFMELPSRAASSLRRSVPPSVSDYINSSLTQDINSLLLPGIGGFGGAAVSERRQSKQWYQWYKRYQHGLELYRNGRLQQAIDSFNQALGDLHDQRNVAIIHNAIGLVYEDLGENQKALESYQEALSRFNNLNDRAGLAHALNNIGLIYDELGQEMKALEYFN